MARYLDLTPFARILRHMTTPRRQLLLWDIDGTLIDSGHAGEFAVVQAAQRVLGLSLPDLSSIDYRGRTDRRIAIHLCQAAGVEPTAQRIHDLIEAYLEELANELPKRNGRVCPGILEVLERAAQTPWLFQGLLTGNMREGARMKLSHYQTWHFFEFGAFADDAIERDELGPHALRRAQDAVGVSFAPEDTLIIGDTPHDIRCGQVIGAGTVAVATGAFTEPELAAYKPDLTLKDFSDVEFFFHWLAARDSKNSES